MQLDKAPPPSPKHQVHIVSSGTLVYHLDILILLVILAFSLFNVPRALVYIVNNRSKSFQGYLLRSAKQSELYRSPSGTMGDSMEKGPLESTEKDPMESAESPLESALPTLESAAVPRQPLHFPMRFSLRNPAASFMHYRVSGGYTILQVLLLAGYTGAIFYVSFYKADPFTNYSRYGWVIASQFPFVYAFATKNNVIGLLVGVAYEKLNYLHRHVGRLMVLGANVHALGYIYKWSLAGDVSQNLSKRFIVWGIVALACFDLLGFFSVQYVRTKYYNIFFGTHAIGLVVSLIAACLHEQACVPFVIAAAATYGLDHIIRVIKTRFATATLRTIPELGLTQIGISSLNTGWRAGQHVRLRVLSTAMGLWGMTEVHPFTIASATNTEDGLVLICKKTGNWTTRLYDIAQTTTNGEQEQNSARKVKAIVEGPYGGVGDTTVPNYSGAMFVVGGSGVTLALSGVQDLVMAGDASRTKVIEVVWSIPDPAALKNFIPLFSALVSQSRYAKLRVSVFYTRATAHSFEGLSLPPGITLAPGRPKIESQLNELVTSMINEGGTHGAFVAVCGPSALSKDVARTVRAFDAKYKKAIGGIQFHEEVFGW